jgi:hypothetical protein
MMYNFIQLAYFAKAKGHKYIKRIPVGTTASGRTKYRYIYNVTHTVGGKHLLDEAHLKVGTKLMLTSKSGEEVHAHIVGVKGDKVTIRYDDGEKKDQNRTISKKELLKQFNDEHGIEQKIKEAREATQAQLSEALKNNVSEKQLKRIQDRIDRLTLETSSSEPSKLHKELLQKHKVNAQQVDASINEWKKTRSTKIDNPDVMMLRRLQRIERHGKERACTTYNNLLEKSASDNQAVLKAVEAYKDLINPYSDPEILTAMAVEKANNLKKFSSLPHVHQGARTVYRNLKTVYGAKSANKINNEILQLTGIDMKKTGMTVAEACEHIADNHPMIKQLTKEKASSEQAKLALSLVKQEIEKSCADFSFANNKYKDGDIHKNHEIHKVLTDPRKIEIAKGKSGQVAFIEDVFEKAYPERSRHKTVLGHTSKGRSHASIGAESSLVAMSDYSFGLLITRAHELAHTFEGQSASSVYNSLDPQFDAHADYQLPIQEAVTLSHMTRIERGSAEVYNGKEMAFGDKYSSLYTGKMYKNGSSEFVSMGVENFFANSDPDTQMNNLANFAVSDPHHFLTTYGILKGYAKHE